VIGRSGLRLALALVAAVALAPATPASAGTPPANFSDVAVATGFSQPTALAFLPSGKLLVTEKTGALKLVTGGTATTLTTIPVCTASEMGLLGIALDPGFDASGGYVYLYRTKPTAGGCGSSAGRFNQVVRVTMVGEAVTPGSLVELLSGIQTDNGNHDGGALRIGPDNKLYVAVGDTGLGDAGAPGASTNPYSQDLGSLNGKVLRLELDGTPAAGNPFIGQPGARGEVYAYGFRNPWRFGFDPVTGSLWAGDVGQDTIEEVDIVTSGGNYAWPRCEGTLPAGCEQPGDVDPVFDYPHSGTTSLGRSITGGSFSPNGFNGLYAGQYFFGDYIANKIYRAVPNAARDGFTGAPTDFITNASGPVDIVFGPDDALYYAAISTGEIRRVTSTGYPRPAAGANLRVPLAIAYQQCTSANRTHAPGLAHPSCNPPVQSSSFLTVGTLDANGKQPQSAGLVRYRVVPGDPGTPGDQADVTLDLSITDVRRKSDLADYTGEVQANAQVRITDKSNGAASDEPATVTDVPLGFTALCASTPGPSDVGGNCAASTTADAAWPGAAVEGNRAIWELDRVVVLDGGADGQVSTSPNTVFARQGVFVP
jgi:glucose/arabinose dehydrogenase